MKLVEIELFQIIILEKSPSQIIVLREKGGGRSFPIYIGFNEAIAIDRKLNNRRVPRPLTHDLLQNVVVKLGGALERIVINDLQDQTFFARLDIRRDGELIEVDSRPSDAIALAVRVEVPIFAAEHVLAATQRTELDFGDPHLGLFPGALDVPDNPDAGDDEP